MFSSKIINFGYLLDLLFSAFTILFTFGFSWLLFDTDWIIFAFGPFAYKPYDEQIGNISFYGSHFKDGDPLPVGIHANRIGADIMKG